MRGRCLCGDAVWEAEGPLEGVVHCHCSRCRKAHGSAFATWGGVPAAGFRWLRGGDAVAGIESSPGTRRRFCARCGSVVPDAPHRGRTFLPLGGLDGDPGARPEAHVFAASRAPWLEIADELPRFDTWPPGSEGPVLPALPRPDAPADRVAGSCLCGAVAYAFAPPALRIYHCHCSRCRLARSAAHASNTFVAASAFGWLRGETLLRSFKVPDADRFTQVFCATCGSPMPREYPDRVVIPAGSLDDDPGIRESAHIFATSKAPWYEIAGRLPRYPGYED